MSLAEAGSIRWHGAKATLTSYMVHFDIPLTKYVRYQGGWKKASEAMPDLYLREAQTVVLKAQVQTLDLLRRGAALQLLEGKPLDYKTFQFPFQRAAEAMELTTAFDYGADGHIKAVPDACPNLSSLHEQFRDINPEDDDTQSILGEESKLDLDVEDLLDDSPSTDTEDSSSSSGEDMELFENFVIVQSGKGKIHKPSNNDEDAPACGISSPNFTKLGLDENWGESYGLCARCFGPPSKCGKMCSHCEDSGTMRRCGRRCQLNCSECDPGSRPVSHACQFHIDESMSGDLITTESKVRLPIFSVFQVLI